MKYMETIKFIYIGKPEHWSICDNNGSVPMPLLLVEKQLPANLKSHIYKPQPLGFAEILRFDCWIKNIYRQMQTKESNRLFQELLRLSWTLFWDDKRSLHYDSSPKKLIRKAHLKKNSIKHNYFSTCKSPKVMTVSNILCDKASKQR